MIPSQSHQVLIQRTPLASAHAAHPCQFKQTKLPRLYSRVTVMFVGSFEYMIMGTRFKFDSRVMFLSPSEQNLNSKLDLHTTCYSNIFGRAR
ncbi:hypothetical protein Y032_0003g1391 [Ancylostoma ceylanicum]|uniref:Uncharacterized protein n=1 Tax=Ancylostoma ceylanicum TaxID=53326 RepID=A0A016VZC6_9BILA|nr:hypothetical protein Y032_0003g1391 [Ancylostoma ceylanicum]